MPELSPNERLLREALRRDIEHLAGRIGERNLWRYDNLTRAAEFLEASFAEAGYAVQRHTYEVEGRQVANLEVEVRGADRAEEIIVIGGHYDSVVGSPGADDNATGSASVLALARAFAGTSPSRTLRFVAFVNEEPPFFHTPQMGSYVYARRSRQRNERIAAMLSLETIGYYSEADHSQSYPFPFNLFYPSTGNFIGVVGNVASGALVREVIGSFRRQAVHPSEGIATFSSIPGVAWSDQWAFWEHGYRAVMVTDTAPYRYPHYHSPSDTPDKIHYDRLALVVAGLQRVLADLARGELKHPPRADRDG